MANAVGFGADRRLVTASKNRQHVVCSQTSWSEFISRRGSSNEVSTCEPRFSEAPSRCRSCKFAHTHVEGSEWRRNQNFQGLLSPLGIRLNKLRDKVDLHALKKYLLALLLPLLSNHERKTKNLGDFYFVRFLQLYLNHSYLFCVWPFILFDIRALCCVWELKHRNLVSLSRQWSRVGGLQLWKNPDIHNSLATQRSHSVEF